MSQDKVVGCVHAFAGGGEGGRPKPFLTHVAAVFAGRLPSSKSAPATVVSHAQLAAVGDALRPDPPDTPPDDAGYDDAIEHQAGRCARRPATTSMATSRTRPTGRPMHQDALKGQTPGEAYGVDLRERVAA